MKNFIFLLFVLKPNSALAPTEVVALNSSDSAKIIRDFLLGFWQADFALNKVQFVSTGNDLRLTNTGYFSYEIFNTNSCPLDGVTISWPPHGCIVKKIDENHLEVTYTLFGGKPT